MYCFVVSVDIVGVSRNGHKFVFLVAILFSKHRVCLCAFRTMAKLLLWQLARETSLYVIYRARS